MGANFLLRADCCLTNMGMVSPLQNEEMKIIQITEEWSRKRQQRPRAMANIQCKNSEEEKKSICLGFLKISTNSKSFKNTFKTQRKMGREQVFYNTFKTHFIIHVSPDFTVFACNCTLLFFLKKYFTFISSQYNPHVCLSWLCTCLWCL